MVSRTALPRLVAAAFLMLAVVVAIIEFSRNGENARTSPLPQGLTPTPLQSELRRCQSLGEAAVHDDSCLGAWAESRRRFLNSDRASERGR